jgi:hypothetical protein
MNRNQLEKNFMADQQPPKPARNEIDEEERSALKQWSENTLLLSRAEADVFMKENAEHIYYKYGLGMEIIQRCDTREQFISFMLRSAVHYDPHSWMNGTPYFVNAGEKRNLWLSTEAIERIVKEHPEQCLVDSCTFDSEELDNVFGFEEYRVMPYKVASEPQYLFDFNRFYWDERGDRRFHFQKVEMPVYDIADFEVAADLEFPLMVSLISHDTFDRCGSITGCQVTIYPVDLEPGIIRVV